MRLPRPLLRPALLSLAATAALAGAAALAACAWSVPADPGMNARIRRNTLDPAGAASVGAPGATAARDFGPPGSRASARSDDGARALYLERCSRCHEAFSPRHAAADEWPGIVRKMGPRANLFGDERARVLSWLQANAR